jgi:hypothetical protein
VDYPKQGSKKMATTIRALGDTIKIDKAFVSGKDRISVNGEIAFEGKLHPEAPQRIALGNRHYTIETTVVSKLTSAISVRLEIDEGGEPMHSGLYDQMGNPVKNTSDAKSRAAMNASVFVGAIAGVVVVTSLETIGAPGGIVGGAIGGLCGGAIGYGMGYIMFRSWQ